MKLFKRVGAKFQEVARRDFSDEHFESHLEDLLQTNPYLLGDLMIVGRQVRTERGERIDLVGLDRMGDVVIIELKRGPAHREIVAQINSYLSTARKWRYDDLERFGGGGGNALVRELARKFMEHFKCATVPPFNRNQRGVIVAESIDDATVEDLSNLRSPITALEFSHFPGDDGEYILLRPKVEPILDAAHISQYRKQKADLSPGPDPQGRCMVGMIGAHKVLMDVGDGTVLARFDPATFDPRADAAKIGKTLVTRREATPYAISVLRRAWTDARASITDPHPIGIRKGTVRLRDYDGFLLQVAHEVRRLLPSSVQGLKSTSGHWENEQNRRFHWGGTAIHVGVHIEREPEGDTAWVYFCNYKRDERVAGLLRKHESSLIKALSLRDGELTLNDLRGPVNQSLGRISVDEAQSLVKPAAESVVKYLQVLKPILRDLL